MNRSSFRRKIGRSVDEFLAIEYVKLVIKSNEPLSASAAVADVQLTKKRNKIGYLAIS